MLKSKQFPVFSVIIPMYNVGQFIEKSIHSVLEQTFKNYEIICVDDGCTDNTLEKLAQFDDHRIQLVRQENFGLSAARNTGINASKGLYVALLDADDFWHKDKLQCHFEHLRDNPTVAVSYSASAFVNHEGEPLGIGQNPKTKNISNKDIFCRNPVGNGSAPVIRRTVLNQIAQCEIINDQIRTCYFDENMRQSEDIECWLRLALSTGCQFEGIDKPLTFYRVNTGGLSANLDKQLAAWQFAVEKNRSAHKEFFAQWYPLAYAYQLRYLARRATQNGNHKDAIRLAHQAITTDSRVFTEEPVRTLLTCACAYLSVLPNSLYERLQTIGFMFLGRYKVS